MMAAGKREEIVGVGREGMRSRIERSWALYWERVGQASMV